MRLKRLEIQGFKSFPDKTVFKFQQDGMTAVVGPNGCGKSNIVDAVRWALGEQSAKLLRGQLMEDVIFNGSDRRKPAGMAEVTLVFENEGLLENQWRDYSEISVSRQLFRTGESEYHINGVSCRLKDVRELIADAGGSSRGYSIVEQGRISLLVNSRPEEKRALIEEAAGVLKYRMRRLEAERKMERTKQNLLRVSDVIREVQRQLNSMKRSAAKARRYRLFRDELSGLDLRLRYEDYTSIQHALGENEEELEKKRAGLADLQNQLSIQESKEEAIRSELVAGESRITEGFEAVRETEARIARVEGEISISEAAVTSLKERLERLSEDDAELAKQTENDQAELRQLELELATIEDEHEKFAAQQAEAEERYTAAQAQLDSARGELDKARGELFSVGSDRNRLEMEIDANSRSRESLSRKRGDSSRRLSDIEVRIAEFERDRTKREEECRGAGEEAGATALELDTVREHMKVLKTSILEADSSLSALSEKQAEIRGLLKTLVALEEQMEGLPEGVRHVMKGYAEAGQGGVLGLVADHIDVPVKYEKAVMAVLGERLDHVIVEGPDSARSAVDYLKKQAGGRGSFIPRKLRSNGNGHYALDKVSGTGIIGPLVDIVSFSKSLNGVGDYLLGDALLVEDLNFALDLWRKNGFTATLVTLDGDVVEPTGIITGGDQDLEETPLARKRKIRELDLESKNTESALAQTRKARGELIDSVGENEKRLVELEEKARDTERRRVSSQGALSITIRELEQLGTIREDLKAELELAEIEDRELDGNIRDCTAKLSELDALEQTAHGKIVTFEKQIPGLNIELEESRSDLEKIRIRVNTAGLRRESSQRAFQTAQSRNREVRERKIRISAEMTDAVNRIGAHQEKIQKGQDEVREAVDLLEKKKEALSILRKDQDEARHQADEYAARARDLRSRISALGDEASGIDIRIHELRTERQHIVERVREEHNLLVSELRADNFEETEFDRKSAEERIGFLREKIAGMGEVNPGAVEEFEELNERYDFLSSQKADLEESIESLQKAIRKINRTSRERFMETFTQVSGNFSELFPRLFDGGSAEMILLDETDPLNTGVEIQVRLPGKRLKSMQLLSGGEKALVSLTMILSMFLTKPSPVCILDEVDAPLDDENLGNFARIIREMSEKFQFLVIT
ncbi:MAG: chromosome segregation protein SMC, partial [Pseudomonadota bacterium]